MAEGEDGAEFEKPRPNVLYRAVVRHHMRARRPTVRTWDAKLDALSPVFANAALTTVTANPFFLVQSWDASLTAGQQYTVFFAHNPGLDAKVDVFSATSGVYCDG